MFDIMWKMEIMGREVDRGTLKCAVRPEQGSAITSDHADAADAFGVVLGICLKETLFQVTI